MSFSEEISLRVEPGTTLALRIAAEREGLVPSQFLRHVLRAALEQRNVPVVPTIYSISTARRYRARAAR